MASKVSLVVRLRTVLFACGLLGTLAWAPGARADVCLDASDEARAALKARHLLEARAKLRLCAAIDCQADVRTLCDERLAEVTERLPTVIFDAKRADGSDLFEVSADIDGTPRPDVTMGAEIALDPGPHVVVVRDPSGATVERRIVLVEREKARREHIVFGAVQAPVAPMKVRVEVPVVYAPPRSAVFAHDAGLVAIGGGAVAALAGVGFGVLAIVRNDAAGCDSLNVCESPGARSEARIAATASTVSLATAVGLGALGITLLVWPKPPARPSRLSFSPFTVGGSF